MTRRTLGDDLKDHFYGTQGIYTGSFANRLGKCHCHRFRRNNHLRLCPVLVPWRGNRRRDGHRQAAARPALRTSGGSEVGHNLFGAAFLGMAIFRLLSTSRME